MTSAKVSAGRMTVFENAEILADEVAAWMFGEALGRDRFAVCLCGGSTPKRLYQRLAEPDYRERFPWNRVHWFWGDERFVPPDHKDSNFRMTRECLLSKVPIPEANIHRIVTEGITPDESARRYETELKAFYGASTFDPGRPLFDLNLLGLGPDGHTASLIPGQPVLEERQRWVAPVSEGRPEVRITLTYPALESSRTIAFLVTGTDKAAMLATVRGGRSDVPAARLRSGAESHWFVDRAAAGLAEV